MSQVTRAAQAQSVAVTAPAVRATGSTEDPGAAPPPSPSPGLHRMRAAWGSPRAGPAPCRTMVPRGLRITPCIWAGCGVRCAAQSPAVPAAAGGARARTLATFNPRPRACPAGPGRAAGHSPGPGARGGLLQAKSRRCSRPSPAPDARLAAPGGGGYPSRLCGGGR